MNKGLMKGLPLQYNPFPPIMALQDIKLKLIEYVNILPVQYFPDAQQWSGEKRLMLAILTDAINLISATHNRGHSSSKSQRKIAQDWIFSDEVEYVFSFINICQALNLDVSYIRKGLAEKYASSEDPTQETRSLRRIGCSRHATSGLKSGVGAT